MLNDYFSLDEDSAYYHSSKTFSSFEANVGTLKKIDRYLVYDDKNIYQLTTYYRGDNILELKAVPYSDISKGEFLEEVYIISDSNVYFKGFQLSEADDQTFEALGGYYSKDKNNVYFEDQIIPGGDAETFHFSKDNYQYTDKNGVYEQGKLVETTAEPTSL